MQTKNDAKKKLIYLIQNAHAGEKAAGNAYYGHAHSLFIRDEKEKNDILKIYHEELHHRSELKNILLQLNARPRLLREVGMYLIGATICILSFFGGWFIPMYGAGKLESTNIQEYEDAARIAYNAGMDHLIDQFLEYAEVEWDHELYFREKISQHPITKWVGLWPLPAPKEMIRKRFETFKEQYTQLRKFGESE